MSRGVKKRTWSIRRRLTLWVAICVGLVLLAQAGLVVWFARDTLRRELDALAVEEVAELRVEMLRGALDAERLSRVVGKLNREHPEANLSLRAWRPPYQEPWIIAGADPRLTWPTAEILQGRNHLDQGREIRFQFASTPVLLLNERGLEFNELIKTELLLDGGPRMKDLNRMTTFYLIVGGLSWIAIAVAGAVFSRRVAEMLERVALSAEAARLDVAIELLPPVKAPVEICRVVDAFAESIRSMRSEHSRNVLLTAGLAHELRSPLQNLISEAEVGLLLDRDGNEYRRLVSYQLEELRALALVVDNLITLTALRDCQALPRSESFDLGEELRLRLVHEHEEANRRGVNLELCVHGDARITGDREAIVLMVRNLVGNAIRWTAAHTSVDLILDHHDSLFRIVVQDHGPGIDLAERESIFDAFNQGGTPTGTRAGYGLGLALARAAARSGGGDIAVENIDGAGARFVVELPGAGDS